MPAVAERRDLDFELAEVQKQQAALAKKIESGTADLNDALALRSKLSIAVADGKEDASKLVRQDAKIEQLRLAISGQNSSLSALKPKQDELAKAIYARQVEQNEAARRKAFNELRDKAFEEARQLNEALKEVIIKYINPYYRSVQALQDRQFADLGGFAAAVDATHIVFRNKANTPHPGLAVHKELTDQGYRFAPLEIEISAMIPPK